MFCLNINDQMFSISFASITLVKYSTKDQRQPLDKSNKSFNY